MSQLLTRLVRWLPAVGAAFALAGCPSSSRVPDPPPAAGETRLPPKAIDQPLEPRFAEVDSRWCDHTCRRLEELAQASDVTQGQRQACVERCLDLATPSRIRCLLLATDAEGVRACAY